MADTIGLNLLRERALLLNVSALSGAECFIDICRTAKVDSADLSIVNFALMAGIFEHYEWLTAAEQHRLGALQLVPGTIWIWLVGVNKEATDFVGLGRIHYAWRLALGGRAKAWLSAD